MKPQLRLLLCGIMVACCLTASWSALKRSLIPVSLAGVVEARTVESGTLARIYSVEVGGERLETDRRVVDKMQLGDRVSKEAWEAKLTVDDRRVALHAGPEVVQFMLIAVLGVGAILWLTQPEQKSQQRCGSLDDSLEG